MFEIILNSLLLILPNHSLIITSSGELNLAITGDPRFFRDAPDPETTPSRVPSLRFLLAPEISILDFPSFPVKYFKLSGVKFERKKQVEFHSVKSIQPLPPPS